MKAKDKTLHAQIIETALWSDCAFCRYHSTNKAIVARKSLIPVCGRCAAELVAVLQEVADEDTRR